MIQTEIITKVLVAALIGALIGYERESIKKVAGLRTHMLVCLSSCILIIACLIKFPSDTSRVIAGIITGMGFIGAGTIIGGKNKIRGITTASSLWLIAILGIIVGLGLYELAIIGAVISLVILELWRFEKKKRG